MQNIQCTDEQGIELLYRGRSLHNIPFANIEQFNSWCSQLDIEEIVDEVSYSKDFNIPDYYKTLDVEQYIKRLASNADARRKARVDEELGLFKARNLYPILRLLIYIVDTMRKHNLVWGVGRGSSVASYCLFLVGIHKIDSVKYNLDIKEFLK
jgi:DNA polymerase III alpha subunit